ncbi:hypothetical protein [Rhodococcus sp. IEGM 1379]|uniref:hypothetical protein n=1 Tax=Rhodococcus sp. IEGM 1379 TaxID=3047086 RepID=UPI0024B7C8EC|nr:hypothetical protein [Rhodococcus sp. IEGM 1379]MDI9919044.1 hypothetical protein [Rhodococcus sp. IEGM 1379]
MSSLTHSPSPARSSTTSGALNEHLVSVQRLYPARFRQALNTADKTLERIVTQHGQLTRRGAAITTEQERRRGLTTEQAATEATQRSRADSEKGAASPQVRERNNRAMMLARQREQPSSRSNATAEWNADRGPRWPRETRARFDLRSASRDSPSPVSAVSFER